MRFTPFKFNSTVTVSIILNLMLKVISKQTMKQSPINSALMTASQVVRPILGPASQPCQGHVVHFNQPTVTIAPSIPVSSSTPGEIH